MCLGAHKRATQQCCVCCAASSCALPSHAQVIFGMLGGMLAGGIMGATKLFDNKYKRLIGIYGAGGWECLCCADVCLGACPAPERLQLRQTAWWPDRRRASELGP